jgi:hypothetical protein
MIENNYKLVRSSKIVANLKYFIPRGPHIKLKCCGSFVSTSVLQPQKINS